MIYIVLRATIHGQITTISDLQTFIGVYNNYDDALKRAREYAKEKDINGWDLLSDRLHTKGYGIEKLPCGCCQEIYAYGFDSNYFGEKISIFEAKIH